MDKDELTRRLERHALWLKTHGRQGDRADFTKVGVPCEDFTGVDLRGALFRHANLAGARFTGARLDDVDFFGTCLYNADFTDASLVRADFCEAFSRCANFTGADLTDAQATIRMSSHEKTSTYSVRGATFTGARLSDEFKRLADALEVAADEQLTAHQLQE